jgi:hypothetical protein
LVIFDAEELNHQTIVFDLTDAPVIAHAIFPELPKPRAVQRLSNAAWVVQLGNPRYVREAITAMDCGSRIASIGTALYKYSNPPLAP